MYISPNTLIDWIRQGRKSIHNVPNHWKALTLSFLAIDNYLAWRIGNGSHVKVEEDAILGCGPQIFLPKHVVL